MPITIKKTLELITTNLTDKKAEDIKVIDIRKLTEIADYMVIATGNSTTHVKALADNVYDELREHGVRVIGTEGEDTKEWIIIDAADIIIHVMLPTTRDFYNLEELWAINLTKKTRSKKAKTDEAVIAD